MNFTADRDEFAAKATDIQVKDESYLLGSAKHALRHYGEKGWYDSLLRRVEQVARTAYRRESGHVTSDDLRARLKGMHDDLIASLGKVKDPEGHIDQRAAALAKSMASLANAVGLEAAAHDDENDIGLEWVTMHDDKVRSTHAEADGQVRRPHEKYDVGGFKMSRPGDTTVPIELWINCRCALRPVTMEATAVTATTTNSATYIVRTDGSTLTFEDPEEVVAAASADVMDDEIDDIEMVDDPETVYFHGGLAPEGIASGDRRKFAVDALTWRDLPLPLAWQKVNAGGHDGSVIVGTITDIWRDENNVLQADGFFVQSPEADEAIGLMAQQALRGVSVDVDDAVMSFQDEQGNEVAFDALLELSEDAKIYSVLTEGRICGATLCAIPAFMEASLNLGPRPVEMDEVDGEFRNVSTEERKRLAKEGKAMEDGSFPIANVDDLKNAIQAIGRAKDPKAAKAHIKKRARALGHEDLIPEGWAADVEEFVKDVEEFVKTEDGPGWLTHPVDTERLRRYWTKGKGAAKIRWGVPGDFNRCRAELAKYIKPIYLSGYCANRHYDALGFWPGRPVAGETVEFSPQTHPFALVAAAERRLSPSEWFTNPGLTEPTRFTITDDGHVFGHIAVWGVCHIGIDGVCTTPPSSSSDYSWFLRGTTPTTDGIVRTGVLTMGTGHAGTGVTPRVAAGHYDNTGFAACRVVVGEDEIGIWFSGDVCPGVTDEQIEVMRAVGSVSGDWRNFTGLEGDLDMCAALIVNVPGFPIPATELAASGGIQTALVASGIVTQTVDHRKIEEIVAAAVEEQFNLIERRKAMAELAAQAGRDPASKMAALAAARG